MNGLVLFADATGQAAAVEALQSAFTVDTVWSAVTPFIPVIATTTLIALGIYIIRRIVKRIAKGKGGSM